jgi:hypothetical protein
VSTQSYFLVGLGLGLGLGLAPVSFQVEFCQLIQDRGPLARRHRETISYIPVQKECTTVTKCSGHGKESKEVFSRIGED